jgi:WD40 repeat protein
MTRVLSDYEALLRKQIMRVSILGEIDISKAEWEDLGGLIAQRVIKRGFTTATDEMREDYPTALACFLVAHGTYAYNGGDYWSDISHMTGIDVARLSIRWGQFFEDFLLERGLAVFSSLGSRRYVDQILMHGGIPNYCLRDFFHYLAQPALEEPMLADLDPQDLIHAWRGDPTFDRADVPVRSFLTYGGSVAVDFVARVMEMARQVAVGRVPEPGELHLPLRVVERYSRWIRSDNRRPPRRDLRLRRPVLRIDPWGGTLILDLPPEELPDAGLRPSAAWIVAADGLSRRIAVAVQRKDEGWATEAINTILDVAADTVAVTFEDGRSIQRTWQIACRGAMPLLVFDVAGLRHLPPASTLPRRPLWLAYPENAEFHVEGGDLLEEAPALVCAGIPYRVECWNLERAETVRLDNAEIVLESIDDARPRLASPPRFNQDSEWPLYVGAPPDLLIPLSDARHEQSLDGWTITFVCGDQVRTIALAEVTSIVNQGSVARLTLSAPEMLGDRAFGCYTITLRGPLGRDALFRFAVVPRLKIAGHDRLRLPDAHGSIPAAELTLTIGVDTSLLCADAAVQIQQQRSQVYHIVVPAEHTHVDLWLRAVREGRSIQVPVSIPLPVLRWTVGTGRVAEQPPASEIIARPYTWLSEGSKPSLLLGVDPMGASPYQLHARLLVHHRRGQSPQVITPEHAGAQGTLMRFDLRAASDSVRASREAAIRIELSIDGLPGANQRVDIPVVRLERALPTVTQIDVQSVGAERVVTAYWHGGNGICGRSLRLWPLWRPWDPPLILSIPDAARGRADWHIDAKQIQIGRYRVEVAVEDDWSGELMNRPALGVAGAIDLTIGSAAEQEQHLRHRPATAAGQLERLLATDDQEQRRQIMLQIERVWKFDDVDLALDVLLLELERVSLRAVFTDSGWWARLLSLLRREPDHLWSVVARRGSSLSPSVRESLDFVLRTLGTLHTVGIERQAHTTQIRGTTLSQDGRLLATCDESGLIKIWQVERGVLTHLHTLRGHARFVACVALNPDATLLASGGADGTIRLWDVATGALKAVLRQSSVAVLHIAFSPNGTHLAACGMERHIHVWRVADGTRVWSAQAPGSEVWQIAFSPNRKLLAAATRRGVQLWDLQTESAQQLLVTPSSAQSLAFQPSEGDLLAVGCADGTIRRWRLGDGAELPQICTKYGVVHTVAFRCDGQSLAAGYGNGATNLWRMCSGELIQYVSRPDKTITCLAFSADGHTLVAGDTSGTLKIYSSVPRW